MSLPAAALPSSRNRRAASLATSQPGISNVAGGPAINDGVFYGTSSSDRPAVSLRGHSDAAASALITTHLSPREPTRSFFHSSFRGHLAPVDTAQYARNVREDTAELASYALSEHASSVHSGSPRPNSFVQPHIESYFPPTSDHDSPVPQNLDDLRPPIIQEVPEPVTPEPGYPAPGTSIITNMIRKSPSSTSPQDHEDIEGAGLKPRNEGEDEDENENDEEGTGRQRPKVVSNGVSVNYSEQTPLLKKRSEESPHPDYIHGEPDVERQLLRRRGSWPKFRKLVSRSGHKGLSALRLLTNYKGWDRKAIWQNAVIAPSSYLPAVILGSMLNILDALSYGMILFPLGQPIFEHLGSAGISMFYISCIISQLVYSCGGSIFKGGIGSEMIEVVPFFHKMAFTIMAEVGENKPEEVIATVITAYAISSILTGLVFFLMGVCRFGYIVGFIPRHILIGCIGGVGWFLIATGFEVSARLEGNLNYDGATLRKMFQLDTIFLWLIPFALAVFLYYSSKKITSKYYLPTFILIIPAVFYFFVFAIDELDPTDLHDKGWLFDGSEAGEPWWYFYTLYDFKLVHWGALAQTIPAMFALTFFGVLHVPINVPALAFNVGEDHLDLDRELIAHGISNALSGLAGSIQNYLVYTNSVLFIKTGGNSRLAGIMLAIITVGIMVIGPSIIGFIPVMMVGVLIFVLGFELLFEAIWEPRRKLKLLEYITVITIVLVMGIYDFVVGIFVGIGLAFVSLVVQTSRIPAVRASYSGDIAGSTVRRNAIQHRYLREVGNQIHVTKLAGYLFFGTIVSVEERIRDLIDDKAFHDRPIRYLIFDLSHVTGIDYSAAEAFNRINRICSWKGVALVMSGIDAQSPIGLSLRNVGLGEDGNQVKLFADLNSALESCENELLKAFYASKEARTSRNAPALTVDVPRQSEPSYTIDTQFSSPRRNHLHQVAHKTLEETDGGMQPRWQNFKEPLRLLLQTFQGLTDKNEDFWFRAVPYFTRKEYISGMVLYHRGQSASGFYLVEEGILRALYEIPQGRYYESIVAGTTCGELPFFSETDRTATVQAERDTVAWLMDRPNWEKLREVEPDVAQEIFQITLKLTKERMDAITSYVLTTAG